MLIRCLPLILLLVSSLLFNANCVKPTRQIQLYPNTEDSPSLYLIGFQLQNQLVQGQYILINMEYLSTNIDPHQCILVNTSIPIKCTNFDSPSFSISFEKDLMGIHNPQMKTKYAKSMIIELEGTLEPNIEYNLQLILTNTVENIRRFSQSIQVYCLNSNGLVYEENKNFGTVLCQPVISPQLGVSILNDLSTNVPGQLSELHAEITINVAISTSLSVLFFVLQVPFQFSQSSYYKVDDSQDYTTNPISANKAPKIKFYEIKTPNIFYIAFDEKFVANRKFKIKITEIKNPFLISESKISIYSANFNSLTPLEQFQLLYPLSTVTQSLSLTLGLPHDIPLSQPCVFYRSKDNFYKVSFNMPMSIPQGYSIKLQITENTIQYGTAYTNFDSLTYTAKYQYTSSSIIIKQMGPIIKGSQVYVTFKANKNSITNFKTTISIDTQQIISNSAASYMFYGRADGLAKDGDTFIHEFEGGINNEHMRTVAYLVPPNPTTLYDSYDLQIRFYNNQATSSGSYAEIFLSPMVEFEPDYDKMSDCKLSGSGRTYGSCISTVDKVSEYVHIKIEGSPAQLGIQPNPFSGDRRVYIRNIRFPQISTNKHIYQTYFRLYQSSSNINPVTYIQTQFLSVLPPTTNTPASFTLDYYSNTYNQGYKYPGFLRFESTDPTAMDYAIEENQVRVLTLLSRKGFQGLETIKNQDRYPCVSNIQIECYYFVGDTNDLYAQNQWQRIHIFFPNNDENTTNFHIIVPDSPQSSYSAHRFTFLIGLYNKFTKDYRYLYREPEVSHSITYGNINIASQDTSMQIDFEGKAGSYRKNVSVTVSTPSIDNGLNFLVVTSSWSLFEKDKTKYTSTSSSNPTFSYNQNSPLSVYLGQDMYMSVFPFECSGCANSFTFSLDDLHMPYHYDLPEYYMYVLSPNGGVKSYNKLEMTSGSVFYESFLNSLDLNCVDNYLGVKNTVCEIVFGTQSPLKTDAQIVVVFSGMDISTNLCQFKLTNTTQLDASCLSTPDNKNLTVQLPNNQNQYHYQIGQFTIKTWGVTIRDDTISQSITVYVYDKQGKYVIEKGTRIFTTTVARPESIQVSEIIYSTKSPLTYNKMSLTFLLPRGLYEDERLGFVMGKDLSDVNLEVKRMRIVIKRISDGLILQNTNQMISSEYKILFRFKDRSQLIPGNYSLELYGIMIPASHENGAFSMIYQRQFDKAFTLINNIETSFPQLGEKVISEIALQSYFNTQGIQQQLVFSIKNRELLVDDSMVWVINFPSYYSEQLFNQLPYCLIDQAPLECIQDSTTPYQMIIKNSPKIISAGTTYTITVYGVNCPRSVYTYGVFQSRYIFMGILANEGSNEYEENALLFPEQTIQAYVSGSISLSDITLATDSKPVFSTVYMTMKYICDTFISANSFIYIVFPNKFDNFNNNKLSVIAKTVSTGASIYSGDAEVIDRTVSFQVSQSISLNSEFSIQFPNFPTPKQDCSVEMSETHCYVANSNRKIIIASSAVSSNSAPIFTFVKDSRYLSFNSDNTVQITAGTYSKEISIASSDSQDFISNIKLNISSQGFIFEPSEIFLKIGDPDGNFRIGADVDLLPISYIYEITKSEQFSTSYTITKNNNIKITNIPVDISIPTSVNVPIGGCSEPFEIELVNPPVNGIVVLFNYDNDAYNDDLFWNNEHITDSNLQFTKSVNRKFVSFCTNQSIQASITQGKLTNNFKLEMVIAGVNYLSYRFVPSSFITVNIVGKLPTVTPTITLEVINQQKSFISFNTTLNTDGILYYHLYLSQGSPLTSEEIKILYKQNNLILQSMDDYKTRMYQHERDERVGVMVRNQGEHTLTFNDLLPERTYNLCLYLESFGNQLSPLPECIVTKTMSWGTIQKASLNYSETLTSQEMNRILCFFTREVKTQAKYIVSLSGDSCDSEVPANLHYKYQGETYTNEKQKAYFYLITNHHMSSDPSPTSFETLYIGGAIKGETLSSALSKFGISYLQNSQYVNSINAITLLESMHPDAITTSFSKPEYSQSSATITISDIELNTQGIVYFILVLYKQIVIDGNSSYVNMRFTKEPTKEQLLNCENWQGNPAQGCSRAVYSQNKVQVIFKDIKPNCMYYLYYVTASDYPLRPILGTSIQNDTIVTFSSGSVPRLLLGIWLIVLMIIK